jgi:hypothetical protein
MADAVRRTRLYRTHEYVIDHAPDYVQVERAIARARQDWATAHPGQEPSEDAILVSGHDDGIRVWWTEDDVQPAILQQPLSGEARDAAVQALIDGVLYPQVFLDRNKPDDPDGLIRGWCESVVDTVVSTVRRAERRA